MLLNSLQVSSKLSLERIGLWPFQLSLFLLFLLTTSHTYIPLQMDFLWFYYSHLELSYSGRQFNLLKGTGSPWWNGWFSHGCGGKHTKRVNNSARKEGSAQKKKMGTCLRDIGTNVKEWSKLEPMIKAGTSWEMK